MSNIFFVLVSLFLLFLNAFFVAAEFGMVKLRHTQVALIEKKHGVQGKILKKIHRNLDAYLSACQLGITLASLGLGWIGEPAFANLLEPLFQWMSITSAPMIKVISFSLAFAILSFFHIVVGELMPKSLAIRQPESISLLTAVPLYFFYWTMYPAIWLLNTCSNFMLKLSKLSKFNIKNLLYSSDEIKLILTASHLQGELTKEEARIMAHTLDFADLKVTEVMRPLKEIIALDMQKPISELFAIILEHQFSRYPVYYGNAENISGVLHIKDLFSTLYHQHEITDLNPLVRPILKVSHRLPALNLLKKFRLGMPHFALVSSGKNKLAGFVTLDNLLHILIGRIKDEFHKTSVDCIENSDGTFTVKGDCSIYLLERALNQDIELNEEDEEQINTVTGLIFHKLGVFPSVGERIKFKGFDAVVEESSGPRIQRVKIYPEQNGKSTE